MLKFRSSVRNKILNFFFLNESRSVYINELARLIEKDPKNVHRMLVKLEEEGILISEFKGKERFFFSHKTHPLYKGYKQIFLQTAGIETILRSELKKIQNLEESYLFGSYAEGRYGPESDIDLLLIGRHSAIEAEKTLFAVQKQIAREISTIHMKPEEFKKRRTNGDQFIGTVFAGKVIKLL